MFREPIPFKISIDIPYHTHFNYFEVTDNFISEENKPDFYELIFVDVGEISVKTPELSFVLAEKQMILLPPCEFRTISGLGRVASGILVIGFWNETEEIMHITGKPATISPEQDVILTRISREAAGCSDSGYNVPFYTNIHKRVINPFGADQIIKNYLESLIISMIRDNMGQGSVLMKAPQRANTFIQTVRDYLTENFREKITLSSLCTLFKSNKTTLCSNFKYEYGETIFNFIHILRVREAKRLIRESRLSMTEISEYIGFESTHYFSRIFKKHTGKSPSEYKKSIRSKLED